MNHSPIQQELQRQRAGVRRTALLLVGLVVIILISFFWRMTMGHG